MLKLLFLFSLIVRKIIADEINLGNGKRIAGGVSTSVAKHCYMAGLMMEGDEVSHLLGNAALISSTTLLTTAHCLHEDINFNQILVVLGSSSLYTRVDVGITKTATNLRIHSLFNDYTFENDIAIVYIPKIIFRDLIARKTKNNIDARIRPVKLPIGPDEDKLFEKEIATVTGFGMPVLSDGQFISRPVLLKTSMVIESSEFCSLLNVSFLQDKFLCTLEPTLKGLTGGDDGAPLVVTRPNTYGTLIGLGSYSSEKESYGLLSAYTRITYYLPWIFQYGNIAVDHQPYWKP